MRTRTRRGDSGRTRNDDGEPGVSGQSLEMAVRTGELHVADQARTHPEHAAPLHRVVGSQR
jgi:hypothetical protein